MGRGKALGPSGFSKTFKLALTEDKEVGSDSQGLLSQSEFDIVD